MNVYNSISIAPSDPVNDIWHKQYLVCLCGSAMSRFLVKRPGQRQREDSFQPLRLAELDAIPGFPIGAETGGGD